MMVVGMNLQGRIEDDHPYFRPDAVEGQMQARCFVLRPSRSPLRCGRPHSVCVWGSGNERVRVLLQRVSRAAVSVDGEQVATIERGLLLLVGVADGDTEAVAVELARKAARLRIFADSAGKLNLSAVEIGAEALVVSQFTLLADTHRGRRPGFTNAAAPELAEKLVERFARQLESNGVPTSRGRFGAHMQVELVNDGPVTIMMET